MRYLKTLLLVALTLVMAPVLMAMQDPAPGDLGSTVWSGLAPILIALVAAGVTWASQTVNTLKGQLSGYALQAAVVLIPAIVGYVQARTGWDLSSAALAASGVVGWLGRQIGVKMAA
jgi:hypothetical protein